MNFEMILALVLSFVLLIAFGLAAYAVGVMVGRRAVESPHLETESEFVHEHHLDAPHLETHDEHEHGWY